MQNEIEKLLESHEGYQLLVLTEEPELIQAAKYLALKEAKWTMQQIADEFGYASRQSVYKLEWEWEAAGILEKARRYFLLPALKEVNDAYREAFAKYPAIIRGVVDIAETSKNEAMKLAAADWLKREIITPVLDEVPNTDSAEQAYISGDYSFQPTDLKKPKFLLKLPRGESGG